jgi:hypothetical protein
MDIHLFIYINYFVMYSQPKIYIKRQFPLAFLLVFIISIQAYSKPISTSFVGGNPITNLTTAEECIGSGLYGQKIIFKAKKGLKWRIFESFNIFDSLTINAASPIPFLNGTGGTLLKETFLSSTESLYSVYGKFESGKKYALTFINVYGDYYNLSGGGAEYNTFVIEGKSAVCFAAIESYIVPPFSSGYSVSVTGGTITKSNLDSSKVEVTWSSIPGKYTLTFKKKNDLCTFPSVLNIAVGNGSTALACKAKVNISVDPTCSLEITPNVISANTIASTEPYIVMLFNSDNTPIPGNLLSGKHAGKSIIGKLVQACSGNSCWSTIKVEDKAPPIILCKDTVVVNCYASAFLPPLAIDNCDAIAKVTLIDSTAVTNPCDRVYSLFINKKYTAKDKSGNVSKTCSQVIAVKRIPIDSILFPADVTMTNALTCNNYKKDKDGGPSPEDTGYPTYNWMNIYLSHAQICNIYSSYEDSEIGYIGCTRKIMRVWTIVEWRCDTSSIRKRSQLIHITDNVSPTFTCPKAKTVSSDNVTCEANAQLDPVTNLKDDCSTEFTYNISYTGGGINTNGGNVVLKTGVNLITYKVSDQCGNFTTCNTTVTVKDLTAPVMVCDKNTTVGLTSTGSAHIFPSSIDDGSYDFCGLDSIKIRRLDDTLAFGETVWFDCKDVGKEIMIELKAWNREGLANSCMTMVLIQDKTPPSITCPPNVTISCEVTFDLNNLKEYGTAIGNDACAFTIKETVKENINQCRVGNLERIFTIYDKQDSAKCSSFIYLTKKQKDYTIKWPKDYAVKDSCAVQNLSPDKLPLGFGFPVIIEEGLCDLFGTNYKDDYFVIEGGDACFKIIRTWTILDYCRMNEQGYEPSVYQQIIKVSNTIDPILLLDAAKESCTLDSDCDNGKIKLIASAIDDCTPSDKLLWKYQIDFNFNGTFKADSTRKSIGSIADASGIYPVGKHQIIFTVEDRCGNVVSKSHNFEIKNCKAPSPVCISNFSVTLNQMTVNGQNVQMACVSAKTLNASSSHFCSLPLTYSFSKDVTDTIKCFTCKEAGMQNLPLFVTDINGNFASCIVVADVQTNDNSGIALVSSKTNICVAENVTLSVSGMNMSINNYLWNTGATTSSITVSPAVTTSYSVTVNSNEECPLSKSITVNVLPKVEALINGIASTTLNVCEGDTTTLTATGGVSYKWSNNQTTATIKVNPTINTAYTVTVTDVNGCTATAVKNVNLNPRPLAAISSASNSICPGSAITLTASGGTSYIWSNGPTNSTNTVTPAVNTTYRVTVTTNGCSAIASKEITLSEAPVVSITGDLSICKGESTSLTAANSQSAIGNTYLWSNGQTTASVTVTPAANVSETYVVTLTNAIGCSMSQSAIVNINPLPIATISPGNPGVCPGAGAVLTASGGLTYLWDIAMQTTPSITVNPTVPTTYTVTVTSEFGCISSASKEVVISTVPNATIATGNATICQGSSTTLTASGGNTYAWNTNPIQTTAAISVSPALNTTYIVTVTNANNCTNTASSAITVLTNNFGSITPLTTTRICIGTSTTLTASGGGTYLWSNNATTAAITVSPTFTTTYTVTVTNNGCTSIVSRIVEVEPLPVALITGNLKICQSGFTTLTATNLVNPNGNIYSWNNGANTPSITVVPVVTTTYTVTILNSGCGGMNNVVSATVTVDPPVVATIAGPSQTCAGAPIILTASGGTTYSWNTNPIQTTAAITVSPLITTSYTVTVSTGPGCSGTATRTVTVLPSPIAAISGDLNICSSESTTLTASNTSTNTTGTNSFAWNTTPPQTTASITVSPTTTTAYTVTITNNNGCSDVETVTVAVNPKITGNDLACKNITESITNLGTVSVKANKFIDFTVVPCNIEEFKFSYSSASINDTIKIYNCDSVGIRNVKIFFYQNGTYLNDSCLATVTITDPPTTVNPNGFCPNNIFKLTGKIATENFIPVEDVEVNLVSINMDMTNENGLYEFPKMQASENYMVQPVKLDNILEGVSTLDLIMIQRHILGLSKLNSPYKLIAADVTNDRKISAADLAELRKVILGAKQNFANNNSWKFIDSKYKFPDPLNPFASDFPLYHEFIKPAGNTIADFTGVKIGDVNSSFTNKLVSPSDEYSIRLNELKTTSSKQNGIGVYIDNVKVIDGFQLEFSMEDMEDISVSSTLFNEEELKYYFDGKILTISVALTKEKNVSGLELFSIRGIGMSNTASSAISLSTNKISDEVYIGGRNYAIVEAYSEVEDESYPLVSNAPNPWNNETTISFELMKEQNVDLIIKDLHGRTIYTKTVLGKLGENKVRIGSDDIQNSSGMLIYEVVIDHKKIVGKMLHLN